MVSSGKITGGVSIIDITPDIGVQLVGYPYLTRENTGVHDPLYATCMLLDDGNEKIMIIHADLCYFEKQYAKNIREMISKQLGIPVKNIMLSCSHTHSGPRMASLLTPEDIELGFKIEKEYLKCLEGKLIELAGQATSQNKSLKIGFGSGFSGKEKDIGGNRNKPDGLSDPGVGVVGLIDENNEWYAVWVKYSLHPTIMQSDNTLVSADYPGYIRKYIKLAKPDAVMMFAQGATGDQSSRFFRKSQTFDEAKRFGYTIGQEVIQVMNNLDINEYPVLDVAGIEIDPIWRELPSSSEISQDIEKYIMQLEELKLSGAPYTEQQTCYLNRLGAEYSMSFMKLKEQGIPHPWEFETPLEIQVFRIGDNCIVGISGEIFVEYTLEIQARSSFKNTFVITLSNGISPGYIVSSEAEKNKVYEAGTSLVKPETGVKVVEEAVKLCNFLYNRK